MQVYFQLSLAELILNNIFRQQIMLQGEARDLETDVTDMGILYCGIINVLNIIWYFWETWLQWHFLLFSLSPTALFRFWITTTVSLQLRTTQAAPPNSRTPRFPSFATAVSPQSLTKMFDHNVWPPAGKWDQQRCRFQNSQHGTSLSLNLLAGFGTC